MRLRRTITGFLAAGLLGLAPVVLTATAASAATTLPTRIHATSPTSTLVHGQSFTIQGYLQVYSQAGCSTADDWCRFPDDRAGTVSLLRKLPGQATWTPLATYAAENSFTFTTTAVQNAAYRLEFSGSSDAEYVLPPAAAEKTVKVKRRIDAWAIKRSGRLYYKAKVTPGWSGRTVKIQKKNCGTCSWYTWKKVQANSDGVVKVRVYAPRSGSWRFRGVVGDTLPSFYGAKGPVMRTYRTYGRSADGAAPLG